MDRERRIALRPANVVGLELVRPDEVRLAGAQAGEASLRIGQMNTEYDTTTMAFLPR